MEAALRTSPSTLDAAELAAFAEDGYVVKPGFYSAAELAPLLPEIDDHEDGLRARPAWDYPGLGALAWHPCLLALMEQLLGPGFHFHHLHASRHRAGAPGVEWHNDYEQVPHTNRTHREVVAFIYPGGLDGTIGDLVLVPRTQHIACDWYDLSVLGTAPLPGEVVLDRLPPGTLVLAHTGLLHCRRPRPGGSVRRFIDVNFCQAGIRWPAWSCGDWKAMYAALRARCPDARAASLFDADAFFDAEAAKARWRTRVPSGSAADALA